MEWKEVRLGDILNFRRGHDLPHSAMKPGNIPVAGSNGVIGYHDTATPIKPILTIGRSGNVGKPYFYEEAWAHNTTLYVDDFKGNDPKFLYYLCQTMPFANFGGGSAVPTLNRNHIHPLETKIPVKVEDQRRIASILSSLDRKIELNNKINADLEEMAQAIFKNWFVDFEPFKDGKFVDSELGMIPEGWKVGCLGDMGAVVCGKTPSKSNSNYYGGDIPFIKIPDMHGNVFVENSEDRLTEEGSLSQIKKFIPPYSLMVSCIATVGLVSINTKPSHTNQQINTVIPHNKSALFYLYQYIKNNEELLKNMGRGGTTTLNVNTRSFSNIRLLIPSEIALEQFHRVVEGLFKKIELNLHESRTLSLLRDTLLPRLMSGELEVPE
ncbi:restriction endonuclease subunit S [Prevotella sp.]